MQVYPLSWSETAQGWEDFSNVNVRFKYLTSNVILGPMIHDPLKKQ